MSVLKFVKDAALGEHISSTSGSSYLPFPQSLLSTMISIPATVIGMPLMLLYTLVRLPDQVARELWDKRQYEKRRALNLAYIAGWKAGKGIES